MFYYAACMIVTDFKLSDKLSSFNLTCNCNILITHRILTKRDDAAVASAAAAAAASAVVKVAKCDYNILS